MKKGWDLTEDAFNHLLAWLDSDREQAGKKYESIRRNLIVIFSCRGCANAEDLADETINRVIRRVEQLADSYVGEPALYLYKTAYHLYLEQAQNHSASLPLQPVHQLRAITPSEDEEQAEEERAYTCLERCLEQLAPESRKLILQYYREDKQAKIDYRKTLAEELGVPLNALRLRVHRIRATLQTCIELCLKQSLPAI
jgi:RNA polymerase sigma factor (sigma-70 family)